MGVIGTCILGVYGGCTGDVGTEKGASGLNVWGVLLDMVREDEQRDGFQDSVR